MSKTIVILMLFSIMNMSFTQTASVENSGSIDFYIHEDVTNAKGEIEQQLISLWQNYISEGNFQDLNSPYYSFENMAALMKIFWLLE
jgi:hypothetical protein